MARTSVGQSGERLMMWRYRWDPGLDWQRDAACRTEAYDQTSADRFFANGRPRRSIKELCMSCAVRGECLSYALDQDAVGIWGGTTTRERREIRDVHAS